MLKKLELTSVKPPNPKYIPKPYEKMFYPGQRVQIDVKFVPESCIVGEAKAEGKKFYRTQQLMNIHVFVILKHLKNTVPTVPLYF